MDIPLLHEMVIIFGLSIAVILACHRLKIPAIVGFLLTGVLAGPHGLGLIENVEDVDVLAEIGIILLLFTVGMEFSLKKIFEYRRFFVIGGLTQILLTVLFGFLVGLFFGRPTGESLFLGFILSLSSTAITLRVLDEKSESDSPHGRLTTGVLIFQDIVAIPMMLLTPFLGGAGGNIDTRLITTAIIGIIILVGILFAATKVVPRLLYYIAKTRSRELFLMSVLTICFSVAWMTSSMGLSLSLGAFLAGLIISDSEYRHEAISDILPFQDVFTSLFFVSIGMLLDMSFVMAQPFLIVFLSTSILLLKTMTGCIAGLVVGMPLRTSILAGLALSQIGEFSFVLAKNGANYGLADNYRYQLFLAVSLLTMGLTPTLISWSNKIADLILRLPLPAVLKTGLRPEKQNHRVVYKNHIIIIGYGLSGKNLALAAKEANIPYVIIEMNPETVKHEKQKGEPIYFGDASHEAVLKHAFVENANAVAIVINDFVASRRIVEILREMNPKLYIIVRTHYFEQIHTMYQLGANEVIPDELGSSVEIFTRVLNLFQIPKNQIENVINYIRESSYSKLNVLYRNASTLYDLKFGFNDLEVESYRVPDNCQFQGKSLRDLNLRGNYGISVVSIKRQNNPINSIDAETQIFVDDVLTVVGEKEKLQRMSEYFRSLDK